MPAGSSLPGELGPSAGELGPGALRPSTGELGPGDSRPRAPPRLRSSPSSWWWDPPEETQARASSAPARSAPARASSAPARASLAPVTVVPELRPGFGRPRARGGRTRLRGGDAKGTREDASLRTVFRRTQNGCCVWVVCWRVIFSRKSTVHYAKCGWVTVCVGDGLSGGCCSLRARQTGIHSAGLLLSSQRWGLCKSRYLLLLLKRKSP